MNLEFFIAKRLISGREYKSSISAPIIKIAIAAVAIGIVMMLIAIATGVGFKEIIKEKLTVFNGHVQIFNYDNNSSKVSVLPVSTNQEFYPEFKSISGIKHIQAVATKAGLIRTAETIEGIIAKGVGKDYNWDAFSEFLVAGRLPDFTKDLNSEILISAQLANRLELKLEDSFFCFFLKEEGAGKPPNQRKFKIVGIYNSGFDEIDKLYLFVDIRHIQKMNKWKKTEVGGFEVFIDDFDELEEKGKEIFGTTLSTMDSSTIKESHIEMFKWIELFDFNISLIIGIMIVVAGINMITALLVLILERTQMIGVFKAIGATNWTIRKIFLYNATYLISVGLFWGNVIGLGLIAIQHYFKILRFPNSKQYYMEHVPVHIDFGSIVVLNLGVLFLCLLMMLIPSYIITKITPVKAIKFE